jgi:Squalene-hopene cyclase C-terminal domain
MRSSLIIQDQTLEAGLDYILALQSAEGCWTDWDLPPGSSSAWTTSYIGYKLRFLPQALKLKAAPHLAAGDQWLRSQLAPGGWGFNRVVGPDADTTSCAILFLASFGQPAPEEAYRFLVGYHNPDGGFSTYLPEGQTNSWTVSHPDVTPMALLALLTQPAPNCCAIERGLAYVLRQQNAEGWWNSFWWDSPLYATEASLSFLHTQSTAPPAPCRLDESQPANPFEKALLLSSMLYCDSIGLEAAIYDLTGQLIAEQQPDGSWKAPPILRITRRDCFEPWASGSPGPLFADPRRLFTTATVLHALSRARMQAGAAAAD